MLCNTDDRRAQRLIKTTAWSRIRYLKLVYTLTLTNDTPSQLMQTDKLMRMKTSHLSYLEMYIRISQNILDIYHLHRKTLPTPSNRPQDVGPQADNSLLNWYTLQPS
jgi:hypothetical protein